MKLMPCDKHGRSPPIYCALSKMRLGEWVRDAACDICYASNAISLACEEQQPRALLDGVETLVGCEPTNMAS